MSQKVRDLSMEEIAERLFEADLCVNSEMYDEEGDSPCVDDFLFRSHEELQQRTGIDPDKNVSDSIL